MKLLQVFIAVSVAVAAATGKSTKDGASVQFAAPFASEVGVDAQGDVLDPKYCVGKNDENVYHPTDCTKYISCTNERSIEMDCAKCDPNLPHTCRNGRLVYTKSDEFSDGKYGHCDYANKVPCNGDGDGDTDPPAATSPNPPASDPTDAPPVIDPPTDGEPPANGSECDPKLCQVGGKCNFFYYCDNSTKTIVYEECGDNLFYNPDTTKIQGGNCNTFDSLSDAKKQEYWDDPLCLECRWTSKGECPTEYNYLPPNSTSLAGVDLNCPKDLIFDQDKHVCRNCKRITKPSTGGDCCP